MKDELLLTQTRRHLPAYRAGEIEIRAIEKGGSDRRFYRVRSAPEESLILVKYNREREENRQYVAIAEFLAEHGIRVPKMYFHDPSEGLIWIEDLGEADLFSFRHLPWPERRSRYTAAIEEIANLHEVAASEWEPLEGRMAPEFNAALYQWEQHYFFENCLGRIYELPAGQITELANLPALSRIAEFLATLPRALVHRDFQSQNIVFKDDRACLIDFQGLRPGLAEYDLASLLYDPYVSLTASEREDLAQYYWQRRGLAKEAGIRRETLRFCAMQRLMQALGAYGYLGLVKGNAQFLTHVEAAMGSLSRVLADIKGVEPLTAVLRSLAAVKARTLARG